MATRLIDATWSRRRTVDTRPQGLRLGFRDGRAHAAHRPRELVIILTNHVTCRNEPGRGLRPHHRYRPAGIRIRVEETGSATATAAFGRNTA